MSKIEEIINLAHAKFGKEPSLASDESVLIKRYQIEFGHKEYAFALSQINLGSIWPKSNKWKRGISKICLRM